MFHIFLGPRSRALREVSTSRRSRYLSEDLELAEYVELQMERWTSGGSRSLFALQGRWLGLGKRQSGSVTRCSISLISILSEIVREISTGALGGEIRGGDIEGELSDAP